MWREGLAICVALQIPEEHEMRIRLARLDATVATGG